MTTLALLVTALLFGGMTLFSFGFAAVLFKLFDSADARKGIRGAFPYYYVWVIATAALAAMASLMANMVAASVLAAIAVSTIYARQVLMTQINAATDAGNTALFKRLHTVSVVIQIVQIAGAGWAVATLA